ncbi:MAG TPA: porin [Hyphomicrobiaceae bacterium]|nr:porin [Hyphomicrobiaceae bacterium]
MGSVEARAADLGGDCCADLEERVAELEATTVRKGNRKVSLTVSGFVAHNVMFWDDGTQSDMYIGDGGNYGSRFRFVGTAKITPSVTAGFLYEFGVANNGLNAMNQLNGGDDLGSSFALRDSTVWLRHSQLGMIKVGHGSTATDNLVLIDLSGCSGACTPDIALYNGGFLLRGNNGVLGNAATVPLPAAGGGTAGMWAAAIRGHESWDTSRRNHILYEAPTLAGFTLQMAVAEDNYWDIALRYAGEHHGFRIAGGIGYQHDSEFNFGTGGPGLATVLCTAHCDTVSEEIKGALSVLHLSTGLFATISAGKRELSGGSPRPLTGGGPGFEFATNPTPDLTYWHLIAGISSNHFGIGRTVLFGEYGEHKGGLAQSQFMSNTGGCNPTTGTLLHDCTSNSKVTYWGLGVTQHIDAAAMELFLTYKNYSLDASGFAAGNAHLNNGGAADFSAVIIGTRINF